MHRSTVIFFSLIHFIHNLQLGDICTLNGYSGTCELFSKCRRAKEDLKNQGIHPTSCGSFVNQDQIICCLGENVAHRKPGELSKRKCREYSRYVRRRKISPIAIINAPVIETNECRHKVETLIIGGEKAKRKEFPHMAAIGYESPNCNKIKWLCGGTIVSPQYILTAAHCFFHQEYGNATWVKIGVTDLTTSRFAQVIKIADFIAYHEYKGSSHYHDIALIKLEKYAKMNQYARPACLYTKEEMLTNRTIATGWGTTETGLLSNDLLKVALDIFDYDFCQSAYQVHVSRRLRDGIIQDTQFCAGSSTGTNDTCSGDSGGPLQIYHGGDDVKCMYDIIGITSFGSHCGARAAVYTRVSHYIEWIEDIVWPN